MDNKQQTQQQKTAIVQQQRLYIFKKEDLDKIDQLKQKIIASPLKFLAISSMLIYLSVKKFNLRRLLANPLKSQEEIAKNDKLWRYGTMNAILMGTLGCFGFSFYRYQLNKIVMFKQYEKEINSYMKWKLDRELMQLIKREDFIKTELPL